MFRQILEETKNKRKEFPRPPRNTKYPRRCSSASTLTLADDADLLLAIKNNAKLKIQNETLTCQLRDLLLKNEKLIKSFEDYKNKCEKELHNLRDAVEENIGLLKQSSKKYVNGHNKIKKEIKELKISQDRFKHKCLSGEVEHDMQIRTIGHTLKAIEDNYSVVLGQNRQIAREIYRCKNRLGYAFNLINDLNTLMVVAPHSASSQMTNRAESKDVIQNEFQISKATDISRTSIPSIPFNDTPIFIKIPKTVRTKKQNPISHFLTCFHLSHANNHTNLHSSNSSTETIKYNKNNTATNGTKNEATAYFINSEITEKINKKPESSSLKIKVSSNQIIDSTHSVTTSITKISPRNVITSPKSYGSGNFDENKKYKIDNHSSKISNSKNYIHGTGEPKRDVPKSGNTSKNIISWSNSNVRYISSKSQTKTKSENSFKFGNSASVSKDSVNCVPKRNSKRQDDLILSEIFFRPLPFCDKEINLFGKKSLDNLFELV